MIHDSRLTIDGSSSGPLPPVSLASRRRPMVHDPAHRTRAAQELLDELGASCLLAAGQEIETIEVDWKDVSALLLHITSLETGLEWASQHHGCQGAGCSWSADVNQAMYEVLR